MRNYTPRRQSPRWRDGDCPSGVLAIYDHPAFADRYTVFYADPLRTGRGVWIQYRAMGPAPFHPQGIGLYGEMQAHEAAAYRYANRHRAAKWSALPEDCKRLVRHDLQPED
jgi:hypothetical protein